MLRKVVVVLATITFISVSHAAPITFEELVKEALVKSPEAAKFDATLADRAADAFSFAVKENPVLSGVVDVPLDIPSGQTEHVEVSVSLSQSLRPSDFGDRALVAKLIDEAASVEKVLALNEFIQSLAVLYVKAWSLQTQEGLLAEGRSRAEKVLNKVVSAADKGLFSEGDIELLKAEIKTFEVDTISVKSELLRSAGELTRLSGFTITDRELARPSTGVPISREGLLELIRQSRLPIQQRYELLKKLSEKQLEVAKLDSFPAVSPAIGYARHDDGISQITFGISVPLPIFNQNQGEIIRAKGALSQAIRGEAYATSQTLEAEALLLFDALISFQEMNKLYESGVIPAKKRAVDAYAKQFDAGTGSIFQIWQAQRELNTARLKSLEILNSFAAVRAQINALTGQQSL